MIITVKVSNAERTLKEKHLMIGADIKASKEDAALQVLVDQAVKAFGVEPDDVQVIINMTW